MYDPRSAEITSPPLASMSEAISLVTDALNMQTASETDIPLTEIYISETDRYRIFQAPEGKRVWLASPAPVIKKNGTVVSGYTIAGGGIIFDENQSDGDGFTVDCSYIINDAENVVTPEEMDMKPNKSVTASVTLTAAGWVEDVTNGWWTQAVSNPAIVDGVKIDLSLDAGTLTQIMNDGSTLMIENNAGAATVYALVNRPSVDITVQIEIRQVTE